MADGDAGGGGGVARTTGRGTAQGSEPGSGQRRGDQRDGSNRPAQGQEAAGSSWRDHPRKSSQQLDEGELEKCGGGEARPRLGRAIEWGMRESSR